MRYKSVACAAAIETIAVLAKRMDFLINLVSTGVILTAILAADRTREKARLVLRAVITIEEEMRDICLLKTTVAGGPVIVNDADAAEIACPRSI